MSARVTGALVRCRITGEHSNVPSGRCWVVGSRGATELNSWVIRKGWASANPRNGQRYAADERHAKQQETGIWAGQFVHRSALSDVRYTRERRGGVMATQIVAMIQTQIAGVRRKA